MDQQTARFSIFIAWNFVPGSSLDAGSAQLNATFQIRSVLSQITLIGINGEAHSKAYSFYVEMGRIVIAEMFTLGRRIDCLMYR